MKLFKYILPDNCPNTLRTEKEFEEGDYDIFYFRITQNFPPEEQDFVPQFFLDNWIKRKKKLEREGDLLQLCQMASISILQEEQDAIKLMKKFRNIGKYIQKGTILEEHGLIIVTPSNLNPTHCSFYAYDATNEKAVFNNKVFQL